MSVTSNHRLASLRRVAALLPTPVVRRLKRLDPAATSRARAQKMLREDARQAAALYEELTQRHPEHPIHWIGLGLAQAALGDETKAANATKEARGRMQGFEDAYLALAELEQKVGNLSEAMAAAAQGLQHASTTNSSPIRLTAAAYAAELGDDQAVLDLLGPLTVDAVATTELWIPLLHASMRREGERAARRRVRESVGRFGDALPLHALMEVYAALGQGRRSRLLNRFLRRLWPHSEFHIRRYALELARAGFPAQADRLLRERFRLHPSEQAERDYCERAYQGGDFAEAARRYSWLACRRPQDVGAYLAWGYALANVEGVDAAERHFERAASSLDNHSALVALAHMAMRRRDRPLTAERWQAVSAAFLSDGVAVTERARVSFDSGEPLAALHLCEAWRAAEPPHQGVDEFHAWLLLNMGRLEQAAARARDLHRRYGPSWSAAEILVQSSGLLGELSPALPAIIEALPRVATQTDVGHLYSLLRLFEHFGRSAEAFRLLLPRVGGAIRLDWAWPYIAAHAPSGSSADPADVLPWIHDKAERDHHRLRTKVSDSVFQSWRTLPEADLDRLLAAAARDRPNVHIVNMFEQASGGSELHALDLGERLKPYATVSFWAPEFPNPLLHAERGVRAIDPSAGMFPRDGVLVFIGVYFSLGPWLKLARPSRILVLYNTFDAVRLSSFVRTLADMTGCRVELLFCSDMMGAECGLPGLFEPSPIDLADFPLRPPSTSGAFTIGRHSRDVPEKHNAGDGAVYQAMLERGARVRLLGASCMREIFPRDPRLQLLPAQRGGVREYLQGLDVFFYRTGTWIEPWGRVVIEAMAMGLPVVVHEHGGYAQAVETGVDGFIFRSSEEAVEQLSRLQDDVELRTRIGLAARRKVETFLGADALKRLLAVYLLPPAREAADEVVNLEIAIAATAGAGAH